MDGLPMAIMPNAPSPRQRTIGASIGCVGVGLHTGRRASLTLHPAPADHGIAFRRTDLDGAPILPATWDRVADTRLCTLLADAERPDLRVGTVEHVMAALAAAGITNALIHVDGPECPILDGSAAPFLFLIDCAGARDQDAAVTVVMPTRPIRVTDGTAFAELRPALDASALDISMTIDFDAAAIGSQHIRLSATEATIRSELVRARTFTMADDVAKLRAAGLARGGSLENAVVIEGAKVLNPAGWRMNGECVRHKALDAVGDLALAGMALRGRFTGHCSGHALNNRLLRAMFADAANWRTIDTDPAIATTRGWLVRADAAA